MEAILHSTDTWNTVLDAVKGRLDSHVFNTWFRPVHFDGIDAENRIVRLRAADITRHWVTLYYTDLLTQAMEAAGLSDYKLDWTIESRDTVETMLPEFAELEDATQFETTIAATATAGDPGGRQQANGFARTASTSFVDIETVEQSLNPKYTFEKFVVGSSNQFAHAASLAAAETPGKTYNPLFIYGGVGLGKTHLMHAIGHSVKERNRHLRVSYITSEKFMNELINAIRYDKTHAFREKYRSIDVLLMDDVQFLAGKERTQEEFFHTFNALHNEQKQIVITSDCPPRDIPTLQERLHSRFEWGLIADIEPPDLETKVAILKRKADLDGIELADDIAIFIASNIRSNVRELEGSLVRLVAISSLRGIPISKMLAQDAMKNIIDSERPEGLTMERIARTVASHYKLTVEELKSKNNARAISQPR
ncbi:MAG TPA: chromosomal replication initiator protein DnaA, partial [Pyrinomonadaceae bacterium]|nr:chromosomal replication initiator protein DnaA [Pyrinomonadaceae bacterium]